MKRGTGGSDERRAACAPSAPLVDAMQRHRGEPPPNRGRDRDADGALLGTLTDGDVRRCLLAGGTLRDTGRRER